MEKTHRYLGSLWFWIGALLFISGIALYTTLNALSIPGLQAPTGLFFVGLGAILIVAPGLSKS